MTGNRYNCKRGLGAFIMRISKILLIALLIGICFQGLAHAQSANIPIQQLKQWDLFSYPESLTVDSQNNVYVADTSNNAVKEIYANGTITTIASGLHAPFGVSLDPQGNIYEADYLTNSINVIYKNGTVATLATGFYGPSGVAVDSQGNIYVADTFNNAIKMIYTNGTARTLAGAFDHPYDIAVDLHGNVYVANTYNSTIKEIYANGTVITLGSGFNYPYGLSLDNKGDIFVADSNNNAIKEIYLNGTIITLGSGFMQPRGVAVDAQGDIYVADWDNSVVKEIYTNGTIKTLCPGFYSPGAVSIDTQGDIYVADTLNNVVKEIYINGTIRTVAAGFSHPHTVALDSQGDIYVADDGYNAVKEIYPDGTVTPPLGYYTFKHPYGAAVDSLGNVYVANTYNNSVNEIYANGTLITLATGFSFPISVAVDSQGNVYVADYVNNTVNEIYTNRTIISLGSGFSNPEGLFVDLQGDLYVADSGNNAVKKIYPNRTIVTLGSGFYAPRDISLDPQGNLYVVDNNAIREFSLSTSPNALFVSTNIPDSMVASNSYNVSVVFTNTGGSAWTSGDVLALWGSTWNFNMDNDTSLSGYPAFDIPAGVTVQPGQAHSWNISLMPQWQGSFVMGFQVVERSTGKWLGNYGSATMTVYPAAPNSLYVSSSIPDTMIAGETYQAMINFTNTGNTTWTSGKGDVLAMWGQTWNYNMSNDTSLSGYPAFSIPSGIIVQPGQTYSWNLTLSPQWPASSSIGFQVVEQSTGKWLGNYGSKTIAVNSATPNSAYVSNNIPNTTVATNDYIVQINFTNAGNTPWTSDKGDMLAVWGQTWNFNMNNDTSFVGLPAFSISPGVTVLPGQTYSWNLSLSPLWPASTSIGFQVVEGSSGKWLGDYGSKTMTVYPAAPNSLYVSNSIPDTMISGNTYSVAVNFTNAGNTTWTSDKGDMLAFWGQTWNFDLQNNTSVSGLPAFYIPTGVTIQPGQTYSWNLTLSPQWPGSFGMGFQVVQQSTGKWLGNYGSKTVTVN